jgi:hypothetical protein
MARRTVTRNGNGGATQISLFDGQAEERTLPSPSQTNEDVQWENPQPNRHHIHVQVHYADGEQALLCTAEALDPEALQRPTTEVCFVGGVLNPQECSICHPASQSQDFDLTLDNLTVFSLANIAYKGIHDRARRVWLRIWAETHDCPKRYLMYSEYAGYYQGDPWPVSKERLLSSIKNGREFQIYCLFLHCRGLRLDVYLRDAIARGEIKAPLEQDDDEEDF